MQWVATRAAPIQLQHLTSASTKGAADYSYPLRLPPALFAPRLAFQYSSEASADTMMPYGWSLSGPLTIEVPTARSYASGERVMSGDGASGTLTLTSSTASTKTYNLKNGSGAHATAIFDTATSTWTVTMKSGVTCTLSSAAPNASLSSVARWRATRCYDLVGNEINYSIDAYGRYSEITFGTGSSATATIKVSFDYESLDHTRTSYSQGYKDAFSSAMTSATIYTRESALDSWTKIRGYDLTLSEQQGVTVLKKVRETGYPSSGLSNDHGPYTTFTYNEFSGASASTWTGGLGTGSTYTYASWTNIANKAVYSTKSLGMIDWNGDGLLDQVSASGTTSSGLPSSISTGTWSVRLQEVDASTGVHSLGSSTNFSAPSVPFNHAVIDSLNKQALTDAQFVDLDGDRYPDVVVSQNSTSWQAWYGTGSGFEGPYTEVASKKYSTIANTPDANATNVSNVSDIESMLQDMNGDGWLDIVVSGGYYERNPGRGSGWKTSATQTTLGVHKSTYVVDTDPIHSNVKIIPTTKETYGYHDLNGDGLLDAVSSGSSTWTVYFGSKSGFSSSVSWSAPAAYASITDEGYPAVDTTVSGGGGTYCLYANPNGGCRYDGKPQQLTQGLIDVDGDGLQDFVSMSSRQWYRNLGDAFSSSAQSVPSWWPSAIEESTLSASSTKTGTTNISTSSTWQTSGVMDFDHDGAVDKVGATSTLSGAYGRPHLMITVDNGIGRTTSMGYTPTSNVYPSGSSSTQALATLHHVVSSLSTSDSTSYVGTANTKFTYYQGKEADGVFLGFQTRYVDQSVSGNVWYATNPTSREIFRYNLDRDYGVQPTVTSLYTDGCRSFAPSLTKTTSCDSQALRGGDVFAYGEYNGKRMVTDLQHQDYGESSTSYKTANLHWDYDSTFANVTRTTNDGGGVSTDAITYNYTYVTNTSGNVSRLSSESVTGYDPISGRTHLVAKTEYWYDNNTSVSGLITNGILTSKRFASGWVSTTGIVTDALVDSKYVTVTLGRGSRGQLTSMTNSETGGTEVYEYAFGEAVLSKKTNAMGHVTQYTVDTRGRVTGVTDPAGVVNGTNYDALDRPTATSMTGRSGTKYTNSSSTYVTSALPSYRYDVNYDSTGAAVGKHYAVFDGAANVMADWSLGSDGNYLVVDTPYNFMGKATGSSRPIAIASTYTPATRSGGYLSSTVTQGVNYYDALGHLRESHQDYAASIGSKTVTEEDPWQETRIDEEGNYTKLTFDAYHRIRKVEQGNSLPLTVTGQYEYDAVGRVVKFTDGASNVYAYHYDGVGRLRVSVGTDTGTTRFTYTGPWQMTQQDGAGGTATWTRDLLGRPLTLAISDPVTTTANYSWTYDTVLTGKLSSSTDATGTFSVTKYDDFGRLEDESRTVSGLSSALTVDRTFESVTGKLTSITHPYGTRVDSTYTYGWLTSSSVTPQGGSANSVSHTYNAWGLPSGSSSRVNLNLINFATNYSTTPLWPSSTSMSKGSTSDSRSYTWKKNGLLSTQVLGSNTKAYTYDGLKRLTGVVKDGVSSEAYAMDDGGNLTSATEGDSVTWTYSAAGTLGAVGNQVPKRTSSVTTETLAYDGAGRVSSLTTVTGQGAIQATTTLNFNYDGLGRLRSVLKNGGYILVIDRDASGDIIRRSTFNPYSASTGTSVYSVAGSEYDSSSGEKTDQALPQLAVVNGQRRWLFVEIDGHVGSVRNDSFTSLGSRTLSSYGSKDLSTSGTPWDKAAFHGLREDSFADLIPAGPRHMLRRAGQWLQPEPLLTMGGPKNLAAPTMAYAYRYAADNPVNFADRSGFSPSTAKPGMVSSTSKALPTNAEMAQRENEPGEAKVKSGEVSPEEASRIRAMLAARESNLAKVKALSDEGVETLARRGSYVTGSIGGVTGVLSDSATITAGVTSAGDAYLATSANTTVCAGPPSSLGPSIKVGVADESPSSKSTNRATSTTVKASAEGLGIEVNEHKALVTFGVPGPPSASVCQTESIVTVW